MADLHALAKQLLAKPKGLLAADESSTSIEKKLNSIGLDSSHESRTAYRNMLLNTKGIEQYLSGIILYDETFRDTAPTGQPFLAMLRSKGILPGIKVDKGTKDLAGSPGEKVTTDLSGLQERFAEYRDMGAAFSKWRSVITIGKDIPTKNCIELNAVALARYAVLSQAAGIVPIVEPEVLMTGDHSQDLCEKITGDVLDQVFLQLNNHGVDLRGMILKPNMVISGQDAARLSTPAEVAKATIRCFVSHVPKEVPGIVFLSGGQTPEEATLNLNAINQQAQSLPWELSFSYGRALQDEALKLWAGKSANRKIARQAFLERAAKVSRARMGQYAA